MKAKPTPFLSSCQCYFALRLPPYRRDRLSREGIESLLPSYVNISITNTRCLAMQGNEHIPSLEGRSRDLENRKIERGELGIQSSQYRLQISTATIPF
jgi:hypothetical protein